MPRPPRPEASGRPSGFVLAMVLWLLVAIAVVVGLLLFWTRERLEEAQRLRAEVDAAVDVVSTRETLLFIAATVPTTRAGMPIAPLGEAELAMRRLEEFGGFDRSPRGGEILLDGTAYAGIGQVVFRLQDESGLLPVARPDLAPLPALLSALGVAPARHAALVDAAADYADTDANRRMSGAEAADYERKERSPPANRVLLNPRELARVYGWEALSDDARGRLFEWTTVSYAGALNLNTAPIAMLEVLLPGCGDVCRARLAARGERGFESTREFEAQTSVRLPGDRDIDYRIAPSEALRMSFHGPSGRSWRIHVRLTPLADQASPWTVDAAYRSPRPSHDDPPRSTSSPLFAAPPLVGEQPGGA